MHKDMYVGVCRQVHCMEPYACVCVRESVCENIEGVCVCVSLCFSQVYNFFHVSYVSFMFNNPFHDMGVRGN